MSLIVAPRASSRFLNRVDDTCPSSLLDLSPISGQSWVGHGAAIDLSALPIPHSPLTYWDRLYTRSSVQPREVSVSKQMICPPKIHLAIYRDYEVSRVNGSEVANYPNSRADTTFASNDDARPIVRGLHVVANYAS